MYDFDRIVKATESCDFHGEFASDIKHCENALSMGGLMAINAECWLDVLNAMTDAEIAEYKSFGNLHACKLFFKKYI